MPELQFYLLGQFQACWDYVPFKESVWRVPGSRQLAQLLLAHRPQGLTGYEAANQLRLSLAGVEAAASHLAQLFQGGATILHDNGAYRLTPGPMCWVDSDAFRAHYQAGVAGLGRGEMLPAMMAFQEADALYQGEYLEEMQAPWAVAARAEFQRLYTDTLDHLAEGHAVLSRYQDAVGFCHKALARDPLREATYQRMMVYYYYLGAYEDALEAYRQCVAALEEAGRTASAETEELWQQLRQRTYPATRRDAAAAKESN